MSDPGLYLGGEKVATNTPDDRLVPSPVGQDDGRMLAVGSDALVYVDAPSGGAGEFASLSGSGEFMFSVFYAGNGNLLAGTSAASAHGRLVFIPHPIPADAPPVDALSISVAVAADAGSLLRLGLYDSDGQNRAPGTLLVDAGTVAADSTGAKVASFSPLSVSGLVYTAYAWQGGIPTTRPSLRGATFVLLWNSVSMSEGAAVPFLSSTGVSGALPATATPVAQTTATPESSYAVRIGLRRATSP